MEWAQIRLPGYLGKEILSTYIKNFTHMLGRWEKKLNLWILRSQKEWGQDLGAKEMEEPTRLARSFVNANSV